MVTYTPEWTGYRWGRWVMVLTGRHETFDDYHTRHLSHDVAIRQAIREWLGVEEVSQEGAKTSKYGQLLEKDQGHVDAPEGASPYCDCWGCVRGYVRSAWPPPNESAERAEWREKMEALVAAGEWP